MKEEHVEHLVFLHNNAKALGLLADELDLEFKAQLQVYVQHSYILEHLIRALGAEHGVADPPADDAAGFADENIKAAARHGLRVYYDCADRLSIAIRKKILDLLEPFSMESIDRCVPDYYTEIRPNLETISGEIAGARGEKDGAREIERQRSDVENYNRLIERLVENLEKVSKAMPSLIDHERRSKRKAMVDRAWQVLVGVLLLVGIALGAWLK